MLNATSVKNKSRRGLVSVSSGSLQGLTLSPLRPLSSIQYTPVYGIARNIVALRPVMRSDSCAFSSNYSDILDPVHGNQYSSQNNNTSVFQQLGGQSRIFPA